MTPTEQECCLVASVLCEPASKFGPNTCTALAYWHYWVSPEASKLAGGIGQVISFGKVPSRPMVRAVLEPQYRAWLDHPMFTEKGSLPMSCVESLAAELLPRYSERRTLDLIATAYEQCIGKPGRVREVARELCGQLEKVT